MTHCVACSGELVTALTSDGVTFRFCSTCDGMHLTVHEGGEGAVLMFVNLNEMVANAPDENLRYFHVTYVGTRRGVHGWMDRDSGKVVQFG